MTSAVPTLGAAAIIRRDVLAGDLARRTTARHRRHYNAILEPGRTKLERTKERFDRARGFLSDGNVGSRWFPSECCGETTLNLSSTAAGDKRILRVRSLPGSRSSRWLVF